ncbi:hypothetical protein SAMN04490244_109142 [Tranquillimonas rosea]|uniref:Uncharacterized protein n=1 Tax=Tranquillimonas rosea TaxID=641238 RepID=A0A1H9W6J0_9RHOB|nr:hypothetical protein [Tranquillimonas rosea]SES29586.1 hypothetical protein SAMN04490244_109142 [Tranquillimonas rosea]
MHITAFLPGATGLAAVPVLVSLASSAQPGAPVIVVGPDAVRAIHVAQGRRIGPRRAPLGVLAVSDRPDFANRLRQSGAWAVLDGRAAAWICGVRP